MNLCSKGNKRPKLIYLMVLYANLLKTAKVAPSKVNKIWIITILFLIIPEYSRFYIELSKLNVFINSTN